MLATPNTTGNLPGPTENNNLNKQEIEASKNIDSKEKQRLFGILRRNVSIHFWKLILVGLIILFLIIGLVLFIILFSLHGGKSTDVDIPCTPTSPKTLLFAYSNDLTSDVVWKSWHQFVNLKMSSHFSKFANVRFDVRKEDDIHYHNAWTDVEASIISYLPDRSLGFRDSNTGSDVLKIIEKFLDNTQASVCGSQTHILVKRYPNETEIGGLVAKLRQHHSSVLFLSSVKPSGGHHPEILYNLATKTNGFCVFNHDDVSYNDLWEEAPSDYPYLIYAANPLISKEGNISLKNMTAPTAGYYFFTMTVQDQTQTDNSETVKLKWSKIGSSSSDSFGVSGGNSINAYYRGNFVSGLTRLDQDSYSMSLNYKYSDSTVKTLQIRVYSNKPVNYWIPYDN